MSALMEREFYRLRDAVVALEARVAALESEADAAALREVDRATERRCRVCGKPGHDECGSARRGRR